MLVTGPWFQMNSKYSVLFDSTSVPATLVQSGVLRCFCPGISYFKFYNRIKYMYLDNRKKFQLFFLKFDHSSTTEILHTISGLDLALITNMFFSQGKK